MQAFPAGLSAELADPFLMCDFFSAPSRGKMIDEDEFEVPWSAKETVLFSFFHNVTQASARWI
jgi:hypothetical protein